MSINSADNRHSTKVSKSSSYLSNEENEVVFRMVGRRSVSQCTTVAQLFITEGPTHSRWIKKYTGALCFIKDNAKRSYYCRMFCLMRHEMVWEQEMYDTIDIARTRPYLLTFEGQVILIKRDNLHKVFRVTQWNTVHTYASEETRFFIFFVCQTSSTRWTNEAKRRFQEYKNLSLHFDPFNHCLSKIPATNEWPFASFFRTAFWHWILLLRMKPKLFYIVQKQRSPAATVGAKVSKLVFFLYHHHCLLWKTFRTFKASRLSYWCSVKADYAKSFTIHAHASLAAVTTWLLVTVTHQRWVMSNEVTSFDVFSMNPIALSTSGSIYRWFTFDIAEN